jgi:hypothetical protein
MLLLTSVPAYRLTRPEIQLRLRFHQPIERERHRPDGQALGVSQRKGSAGGVPQLRIEHGRAKRNSACNGGVVGIGGLEQEASGGEPPPADPAAQALGHSAKDGMQDAEVVGVGGKSVDQVELRLPLGRKHRPWVDTLGPGAEDPTPAAEHGAERALGDGRHLADQIELIVFQPHSNAGVELGKHIEGVGCEKTPLFTRGYVQL